MPVTIIDPNTGTEKRCIEPAGLAKRCREIGLDTSWFGLANSYTCPRGCRPGEAWLLLLRTDLDTLLNSTTDEASRPYYFDVKFISNSQGSHGTETATIKRLVFLGAECVTPGARESECVYLVQLQDRRYLLQRYASDYTHAGDSYNTRHLHVGYYMSPTLKPSSGNGTPWTWQQMLDDMWPDADPGETVSVLGPAPSLPWIPVTNPEDLSFEGMTDGEAIEKALAFLNCELAWDPIADACRYVVAGEEDTQFEAALAGLENRRVWDGYRKRSLKANTPRLIYFMVRRRGIKRNAGSQRYRSSAEILTTGSDGSGTYCHVLVLNPRMPTIPFPSSERRWPETCHRFYIDLERDYDESIMNTPDNTDERIALYHRCNNELAPRVFASLEAATRGLHVVYPFALSNPYMMPGPQVSSIRWAETGAGFAPHSGMVTEIRGNLPVKNTPPLPDTALDPFHARIVRCTSAVQNTTNGYWPGLLLRWVDSHTSLALFSDPEPRANPIWLHSINGNYPQVNRNYLGVYQTKRRHDSVTDPLEGVWAIDVQYPPPS